MLAAGWACSGHPALLVAPKEAATAPAPAVPLPSTVPSQPAARRRTTTQQWPLLGELDLLALRDRGSPFYLAL